MLTSIRNLYKFVEAIQNGLLQAENSLFNVAPTSGNIFVGVGILGGPHGTLDYRQKPCLWHHDQGAGTPGSSLS